MNLRFLVIVLNQLVDRQKRRAALDQPSFFGINRTNDKRNTIF